MPLTNTAMRLKAFFFLLAGLPCFGQPSSTLSYQAGPVATLPTNSNASALAIGDFDGDTRLDLAVTLRNLNVVQVYRQTPTGYTLPPASYPAGTAPSAVEAVPVDQTAGQPANDLLVLSGPSSSLTVFLNDNNAQGTLTALPANFVGTGNVFAVLPSMATGYFDSDGYIDVAFSYDAPTLPGMWLLKNSGVNTFSNPQQGPFYMQTNGVPGQAATYDMDGDGKLDMLAPMSGSNEVRIWYNSGRPMNWFNLGNIRDVPTLGTGPVSVAAADINNDSRPDMAVANATSRSIVWVLATSAGQYGSAVTLAQPAAPVQVLLQDMDRDGTPDLLVLRADNTLNIYRNTLRGGPDRFDTPVTLSTGANPVAMRVADLNLDGYPDIAVACAGDNTVRTYLSSTPTPTAPSTTLRGLAVYPNPARQTVSIALDDAINSTAVVRDGLGRVVLQSPLTANTQLKVGDLPRGVYTIHIVTSKGNAVRRLVLE